MQKSRIKEYEIVIEQDENKVYVAYVPELPGCHTEGDTINEVIENIKEAMDLYFEYIK
ncbi:MAG: type II toxin-antitoxin system HicB family antitoxin [Candidatus Micrarchaeota archaeon]